MTGSENKQDDTPKGSSDVDLPYPHTGLAAAGFAVALVICAVPNPPALAARALGWLAFGIPLAVAAPFLWHVGRELAAQFPALERYPNWPAIFAGGLGDIACLGGVYWLFASISVSAAQTFISLSVAIYMFYGVLVLALQARRARRERGRGPH